MKSSCEIQPTKRASSGVWLLFALALLFLSPLPTSADTWQAVSIHGADVRSLAVDPQDGLTVIAGTSGGQVYRTTDGGESWQDAGAAVPFPGWVLGTLTFDPNQRGRVWAGLWALWGNDGFVAYSDDLGTTWTVRREGLPQEAVYDLALVPGRPGKLVAALPSGVWGSEDDGHSWQYLSPDMPQLVNASSLLVDPFDPDTIYAGTWRRAYRSDDGGASWKEIFEGMVLDSDVFTLQPVLSRPGEIWAATCGWVYRSENRGGRWQRHQEGMDERRTQSFLVLPDGALLAGTVAGLYRSENGGQSWRRTSREDLAISALARGKGDGGPLYVATEGSGVWVSFDDGRTLRRANRGMSNLRISALAGDDHRLFAAVNFAGPASGIYRRSGDDFIHDHDAVPTVLDLAMLEDHLFAATEGGLYVRSLEAVPDGPATDDGAWHRLDALGEQRIEQLVMGRNDLLVRTAGSLWRWRRGVLEEISVDGASPRSAAYAWGRWWILSDDGLLRIQEDQRSAAPVPPGARRLVAAGGFLTAATDNELWIQRHPERRWEPLGEGIARALVTGDERFPLLLAGDAGLELIDPVSGERLELPLPVPVRDLRGARIHRRELLLATSGFGLLRRPLPPPPLLPSTAAGRR
ncbi:MAG: hypothetical protein SX243_21710 [Acidobacteriota bacterium]|nr:hypothetical protein [Acidobacteriota bacterium]